MMNRRALTLRAFSSWNTGQFTYGSKDCCQFAAHVAEVITGHNYVAQFAYASKAEADQLITPHGSLDGLVRPVLGEPSADLQDGDPVLVDMPIMGQAMGVKLGKNAVALYDARMIQIASRYWTHGWSLCRQS